MKRWEALAASPFFCRHGGFSYGKKDVVKVSYIWNEFLNYFVKIG